MGYRRIPSPPRRQGITDDGRGKWNTGVQQCEERGGGNVQGARKTEQREDRNIALPQFDLADIRASYARSGGEYWLGHASLFPVLTEDHPQALQRGGLRA